jgi:hypothetical protein
LCSKSCSRWVFLRAFFFGGKELGKHQLVSFCMVLPLCHCLQWLQK